MKQDQRFAAMLRREVEQSPLPSNIARHPPAFNASEGEAEAKASGRPRRRPPPPPPDAGGADPGAGDGGVPAGAVEEAAAEGQDVDEGTSMALDRIRSGELDVEQVGNLLMSEGLFTEFDDPTQAESIHTRYALGIGSVKAIRMLRQVQCPCPTHVSPLPPPRTRTLVRFTTVRVPPVPLTPPRDTVRREHRAS